MGGFECATHRRRDNKQIDVLETTGHSIRSASDYRLLAEAGVKTVRDGLRWHLIEAQANGVYDWSSFAPMLDAALETRTQVIWDLCHWGIPDGLDVFSEEFVERFRSFAEAASRFILDRTGGLQAPVPLYCPINEISFWSWVGGDVKAFAPHQEGRGPELKRQLARASIAAIRAIRSVDPRARFVQAEPIIDITPDWEDAELNPDLIAQTRGHTASQFEAWDLISGRREHDLGGSEELLDLIGVNYYWNNQWVHEGDRKPLGHPDHKPLHIMLLELWQRYQRPILVTETGAESDASIGWLGYISSEVRQARRKGVEILGICIYPVTDYPGWDDDRHCHCGLIAIDERWQTRHLRAELATEIKLQASIMRQQME